MARITTIEFAGTPHEVEVANRRSVMQGTINNNIPGIEAECGGACCCATCHAYVDPAWFRQSKNRLAPLSPLFGMGYSIVR